MRGTHRGRPGTPVIPPGWEQHLAPATDGTKTARCDIRGLATRDDDSFNPDTGLYPEIPGPLRYTGRCRVQRVNREQVDPIGEQNLPTTGYLVSIDRQADTVHRGDTVTVTATTDGQLLNQQFKVTSVLLGSARFQRDLFCTDDISD